MRRHECIGAGEFAAGALCHGAIAKLHLDRAGHASDAHRSIRIETHVPDVPGASDRAA